MQEGIYIAASGAIKQSRKMDVISNNLANLGNSGFKRDGLAFKELIPPFASAANTSANLNVQEASIPSDFQASYVGIDELYTDVSNGTLRFTGNDLDLGLDGEGFIVVESSRGLRYTRNGNLKLLQDGSLATHEGGKVIGQNGKPIKIDLTGGRISIDVKGAISVGNGFQNVPQETIKLVAFNDPTKLKKEGDGLFIDAGAGIKENPPADLKVQQGFLETANVNPVEEMVNMITTLRAFEAYQKIIQSIDEADEQVVNTVGRVA